jgi:hypothetical protein
MRRSTTLQRLVAAQRVLNGAPMKKTMGAAAVLVAVIAGCGDGSLGREIGCAIGNSLGSGFTIIMLEQRRDGGEQDAVEHLVDGGTTWVSGETDAGRLYLAFDGPFESGAFPVDHGDGGACDEVGDRAYLLVRYDGGGVTTGQAVEDLQAQVDVSASDAGLSIHCTQVQRMLDDGGTAALPDRTFSF